jgi:hypothetical protein
VGRTHTSTGTLLLEAEIDRPNLELNVVKKAGPSVTGSLLAAIADELRCDSGHMEGSNMLHRAVVFCLTRYDATEVAAVSALSPAWLDLPLPFHGYILSQGLRRMLVLESSSVRDNDVGPIAVYHAGLSPPQKRAVMRRWGKAQVRVLVTTSAMGMGMDAPDVSVVIHHSLPTSLSLYWQQVHVCNCPAYCGCTVCASGSLLGAGGTRGPRRPQSSMYCLLCCKRCVSRTRLSQRRVANRGSTTADR